MPSFEEMKQVDNPRLTNSKPLVHFRWIRGASYQSVWDLQTEIHQQLIQNRRAGSENYVPLHQLIFCEHNHVYTLGKSGSQDHLLLSYELIQNEQIEFFKINRGGDITYHGPGQITGYPIFDLEDFFRDVHKYVRLLEESIIQTITEYGLEGMRIKDYTGVWLPPDESNDKYRKICAIGVHLSRWVSMHGFAFNVNTDLGYFENIVPCGIQDTDKTVTSLQKELGEKQDINQVGELLKKKMSGIFGFEFDDIKQS